MATGHTTDVFEREGRARLLSLAALDPGRYGHSSLWALDVSIARPEGSHYFESFAAASDFVDTGAAAPQAGRQGRRYPHPQSA